MDSHERHLVLSSLPTDYFRGQGRIHWWLLPSDINQLCICELIWTMQHSTLLANGVISRMVPWAAQFKEVIRGTLLQGAQRLMLSEELVHMMGPWYPRATPIFKRWHTWVKLSQVPRISSHRAKQLRFGTRQTSSRYKSTHLWETNFGTDPR